MRQTTFARRQSHWDLRAAGNFIGGGTGTGLILAAALAWSTGIPVRTALAAGLGFVALGLLLVWLKIGRPWRALNVFRHPQRSWMTREGIVAAPLFAAGAAALAIDDGFILVAAAFAAGYAYSQARILKASRAIPAWSQPLTVPVMLLAGLAEGTGAFLVIAEPADIMAAAALLALLAREAATEAYRRRLIAAGEPQQILAWFTGREWFWLRISALTSMLLLAAGIAGTAGAAIAGGTLAVLGGWSLKTILITRAAFTRGPRIPCTPTRGRSSSQVVIPS